MQLEYAAEITLEANPGTAEQQKFTGFRAAGMRRVYLEVTADNAPAVELYRSLGFTEIAPYNDNPPDITTFMSLKL